MDKRKSIEQKLEANHTPQVIKTRPRSSFFGYNSLDLETQERNEEIELYVNKLQKEFKEWPEKYISERKKLQDYWKNEESPLDKSELTQEQQDHLSKAVNMEKYVDDYNSFCKKVHEYALKKQWFFEKYQYTLQLLADKIKDRLLAKKMKIAYDDRY